GSPAFKQSRFHVAPWSRKVGEVCFFFQAEDGIRDATVTGVQTCALPISYLTAQWEPLVKDKWAAALQQGGVWRDTIAAAVTPRLAAVDVPAAKLEGDGTGLALIAYPSLRFYDGRTAGSSWLHETPDMMTQATWDALVDVASETATKLGVANGDVLRVSSPHGTVELPAYVSPTIHPGAVAIPIGHRYAPFHRRYVT